MTTEKPTPNLKAIPDTPFWDACWGVWFNTLCQYEVQAIGSSREDEHLAAVFERNWIKDPTAKTLWVGHVAEFTKGRSQASIHMDYKDFVSPQGNMPVTLNKAIAWINTFQKIPLEDVAEVLEGCRQLLAEDGVMLIRMPDREAEDFQLNEHDATVWTLDGVLELLWQNPYFKVAETYLFPGGKRDYLLKPINGRPRLCAGIIAKNEERDLPKCLKSLEGVVEGLVFIDTGSTDKTVQIVEEWAERQPAPKYRYQFLEHIKGYFPCHIEVYTDASKQDERGEWKLWSFSQARNVYVEEIERMGFDYVLWMDADDILLSKKLKNLVMWDQYDVHGIQIKSGGLKWPHHRLWKTGKGIRYSGRCHEYPGWGNLPAIVHPNIEIYHDQTAGEGENSNDRNLRILKKEFEEAPTPRVAFYLANTYKDRGSYAEAIPIYEARIAYGKGYEDEYWFAVLYKARCERYAGKTKEARTTLLKAVAERPDWAEFWMELCYCEAVAGLHKKALGYALIAQDLPVAPTQLFRERDKYIDQPYRYASHAYEGLGRLDLAFEQALEAQKKIGKKDAAWDERIDRLAKSFHEEPEKKSLTES